MTANRASYMAPTLAVWPSCRLQVGWGLGGRPRVGMLQGGWHGQVDSCRKGQERQSGHRWGHRGQTGAGHVPSYTAGQRHDLRYMHTPSTHVDTSLSEDSVKTEHSGRAVHPSLGVRASSAGPVHTVRSETQPCLTRSHSSSLKFSHTQQTAQPPARLQAKTATTRPAQMRAPSSTCA